MTDVTDSGALARNYSRKRRVFATADMTDEDAERIAASFPTQEELRTGRWAWQSHEVRLEPIRPQADPCWPAVTPARKPRGTIGYDTGSPAGDHA